MRFQISIPFLLLLPSLANVVVADQGRSSNCRTYIGGEPACSTTEDHHISLNTDESTIWMQTETESGTVTIQTDLFTTKTDRSVTHLTTTVSVRGKSSTQTGLPTDSSLTVNQTLSTSGTLSTDESPTMTMMSTTLDTIILPGNTTIAGPSTTRNNTTPKSTATTTTAAAAAVAADGRMSLAAVVVALAVGVVVF